MIGEPPRRAIAPAS